MIAGAFGFGYGGDGGVNPFIRQYDESIERGDSKQLLVSIFQPHAYNQFHV